MEIVTLYDTKHDEAVLRRKALPVEEITPDFTDFTQNMIDYMVQGNGIGLAAPQIGDSRRIFVIKLAEYDPMVFINPEIIQTSVETSGYEEGCLSVPGVYAKVLRPAFIKVQAWKPNGRPFQLEAEGLLATVIQHEYDHLNGTLFIDHLGDMKRKRVLKNYTRQQKK